MQRDRYSAEIVPDGLVLCLTLAIIVRLFCDLQAVSLPNWRVVGWLDGWTKRRRAGYRKLKANGPGIALMRQPHDTTDVSWKGLHLSARRGCKARFFAVSLTLQAANISLSRVIASFASERGAICGGP